MRRWLRLPPSGPADLLRGEAEAFDVSASSAYWGEMAKGRNLRLIARGGLATVHTATTASASDALAQDLIAAANCATDGPLHAFFWRIRHAPSYDQVEGALGALLSAKEDGLISLAGICIECGPTPVLSLWQQRHALDAVICAHEPDSLLAALGESARARGILLAADRQGAADAGEEDVWISSPEE